VRGWFRPNEPASLQKHDSEIIAVRQLLAKTEFTDRLLALDALHNQHEPHQQILYDHGADYLVPLKENQKTILATAKTLLPETLSPSGGSEPPPFTGLMACARKIAGAASSAGSSYGRSPRCNWDWPGQPN